MILLLEQIHLATTLDTCKDSPLLKTPQPVNAVLACAKGGQMHVSYIFLALTCMPSGTVPPSVILWVKFLCLFSWISFVTLFWFFNDGNPSNFTCSLSVFTDEETCTFLALPWLKCLSSHSTSHGTALVLQIVETAALHISHWKGRFSGNSKKLYLEHFFLFYWCLFFLNSPKKSPAEKLGVFQ